MAELLAPRFSKQQFAVLVHRPGVALFWKNETEIWKNETEMKTDKPSSRAEELLAELGLDYQCSEVSNMSCFVDQHRDKLRFMPENEDPGRME